MACLWCPACGTIVHGFQETISCDMDLMFCRRLGTYACAGYEFIRACQVTDAHAPNVLVWREHFPVLSHHFTSQWPACKRIGHVFPVFFFFGSSLTLQIFFAGRPRHPRDRSGNGQICRMLDSTSTSFCYEYIPEPQSYSTARDICQQKMADLAWKAPPSWLNDQMRRHGNRETWVGARLRNVNTNGTSGIFTLMEGNFILSFRLGSAKNAWLPE